MTVEDLFYYFPRRYEDRTHFYPISQLREGGVYTVKGTVVVQAQRGSWRRSSFKITEILIADESERVFCIWFNQPYLKQYFKVGTTVIVYGKVQRYGNRLQFVAPEFEIVDNATTPHPDTARASLDTQRIVPIYTLPERMSQRTLRGLIFRALEEYLPYLRDPLTYDIRSRNGLFNLAQALRAIHFPDIQSAQEKAYERLSFEEFFMFQVPLALRKLFKRRMKGISHAIEGLLADAFIKALPFDLTDDQKQVFAEIKHDMRSPRVMRRLLQGDVGSGKTVIAVLSALVAIQGGYQVAFMVPTEVLARQHFEKLKSQMEAGKGGLRKLKISLLTGSMKEDEKRRVYDAVKKGNADLVIGTHALLEEAVKFKRLGLVVIDEQHKFGVGQRALLSEKGGSPDVLIMTATPIPRTLAITLYGDLDVSVIAHLPPGRQPVETMHLGYGQRGKALEIAREELSKGNQIFIVYPVIDESSALDIAGAEKMFHELSEKDFKEYNLGLIHGRMSPKEQESVMKGFREGEVNLLVATTVLEVGIDVARATCMIIEHAERFGLSQLHQLRGRIGRGASPSICVLVSDPESEDASRRIDALVRYRDGFRIAQEDLKIRGPGEFFGTRQHGLTELKIGNPLIQLHLLKRAREEALRCVAADPELKDRMHVLLKQRLLERFPEFEKLMIVG